MLGEGLVSSFSELSRRTKDNRSAGAETEKWMQAEFRRVAPMISAESDHVSLFCPLRYQTG
jgi:hypothetical protein